jgi:hypothetical protein
MGRPKADRIASTFEDDVVQELLTRTENGEPLTQICADKRMPSRRTVYEWIEADEGFAAQFRAARARGVHALAEECLTIADKPSKDAVEATDKRIKIDTRLRLAGKWLPSIYGEKVDVNHTGEVVTRHDLSAYSADELDALEKLIAKASDVAGDQGGESPPSPGRVH